MTEFWNGNLRTADAIIHTLIESGVTQFFIVTGGNAMYLHDALRLSGARYTTFQHEQAAAMAADAYSRITGEVSACIVTSGPAVSNLVTGVVGAYLDSSPVVFISGQSKSTEIRDLAMGPGVRQFGTFEIPGVELMNPICKVSTRLTHDIDAIRLVTDLVLIAKSGRPGPVFLEVPLDLQGSILNNKGKFFHTLLTQNTLEENPANFTSRFLEELSKSKSPIILAGHGVVVSRESNRVLALSAKLGIPIVTTQLAKEIVPYESDSFVGHVGIRGDRAGNLAIFESDCILIIGCSLQQQTIGYNPLEFAPRAKIFLIDFEHSVSSKQLNIPVFQSINCSTTNILNSLESSTEKTNFRESFELWKSHVLSLKSKFAVSKEPHKFGLERINLYKFVEVLNQFTQPGDVILSDAGLSFYVMGQAFRCKSSQKYIVSGGLGSMGYALPAAVGAAISNCERVIAVTGDGSLQMNVQELATLSRCDKPIFIFVINNEGYASIRNSQRSFFGNELIGSSDETGVSMPVWADIAKSYSVSYFSIKTEEDLVSKLSTLSKFEAPVLVEVFCHVDQQIMPLISSTRSPEGKLISNPLHMMSPLHESDIDLSQQN